MAVAVEAHASGALLADAHASFEAGELERAAELTAAAYEAAEHPPDRAEAATDAAVICYYAGAAGEARMWAERAVSTAPGDSRALETLGLACEADGDPGAAAHWLRRALAVDAGRLDLWASLARIETARGRVACARASLSAAGDAADASIAAALEAREALQRVGGAAYAGSAPRTGRVLIVVEYFHPSVGGSERLAESAGEALKGLGWHVEVATNKLPNRRSKVHRGMRIHEVSESPDRQVERIIRRRAYDAVLVLSSPTSWPHAAVALEQPRPWTMFVPCVNEHNTGMLKDPEFPERLEAARTLFGLADVLAYSSHAGWDARLLLEFGLPGVYLPNAVPEVSPAGAFRARHGIDGHAPLLVAIGNLWPEKRHPELAALMRDTPGDWRLCLIGRPVDGKPEMPGRLAAAMAGDPRQHHVPGATPGEIASALREATALLLPSAAEATPLVLLEAMSHGVPWIATPTCGSADDHAGGLVVPLEQFPTAIEHLLGDPSAAARLGAAGRADFEARYTWDALGPRYARLLAGDVASGALEPPSWAVELTDAARAACRDAVVTGGRA